MKQFIIYSLLLFAVVAFGQEKDKALPKANDEFAEKKFANAEADYRISQSNNPKKAIASYNLGNSIYRQNQIGEAQFSFSRAIKNATIRPEKHQAFHNLGNTYMKEKNYSAAVEAYKNALRNDPADEESRYNFALAKKLLKYNPPKKDDKKDKKDKKDKQDKKDKKDDKKDKKDDKPEKEKDKKDQNGKDKKDPNKGQDGKPKPEKAGISKQRLQNLLDAVNNEEKKIQDRVNANKAKGKPVQTDKDW